MKLATDKQINFINSLAAERNVQVETKGLSRQSASDLIGNLLKMPRPAKEVSAAPVSGLDLRPVPSGRYAAEDDEGVLRFFKINAPEQGRWAGWIFVDIYASDYTYKQGRQKPGQAYSGKSVHALTTIASDPKTAAMRYGQELGVCGVCGRTLTDPESIAKGIGPVCEGRF